MWILLAGSLLSLTFLLPLSLLFLGATLVLALSNQVLTLPGAIVLAISGMLSCFLIKYRTRKRFSAIAECCLVCIAVLLTLHWVPGFHNPKILAGVQAGPLSAPFTLYYNLDKAVIPFILLICLPTLFNARRTPPRSIVLWFILIAAVPALLFLAVLLGGLRLESHRPEWIWQFALANLFFVSLAEEALFRGYLQQRLNFLMPPWASLVVTSALFGCMHFAGGVEFVLFAGLAGIIYGLAWMWSGKLWVATLFHFFLNVTHLLFFTYPLYLPAGHHL